MLTSGSGCALGTDNSQVDAAQRTAIIFKSAECLSGIPHAPDPQCPRKIIAAAARNHKQGNVKFYQVGQMPMDRAIPAKEDRGVRLLEQRGPFDACEALEVGDSAGHTSRPQDGRGAHARN